MELKSLLIGAAAGVAGLYFYNKEKDEKSKPNPEREMESKLEEKIREMEMRERLLSARLPDRY